MNEQQFLHLRKQYMEQRFAGLNPVQRQAVFETWGPVLILAGAGSGKTTVLVNRIANLIRFGHAYHSEEISPFATEADAAALQEAVRTRQPLDEKTEKHLAVEPVYPYHILAITFTNKAAGELKERLARIAEGGEEVAASTFHSACVRMLRKDGERLGYPKAFTIYDSDDQQRVLKAIYKERNMDDSFLSVRAAASAIGRLKDNLVSAQEASDKAANFRDRLVAEVYTEYARRLKAAGAFDFDDLIFYTVKLLEQNEDLKLYYKNRWRYVMVDEYQDTSHAQFRLVQLLSLHGNLCVVGDDDQSIYKFRGATVENILGFEEQYPGARVIRLEQNYRSTKSILKAANAVIENNPDRKGKTLWTENDEGDKIYLYEADSEQDEAIYIAAQIGENLRTGAKLSDHAVLYRMNAQSNAVETYFARAGIPYKVVGGLRFYERKEIKDILAYMAIVANPQDTLRLARIINEPARKIGPATLAAVLQIAAGAEMDHYEVMAKAKNFPALSRAAGALGNFSSLYNRLQEAYETLSLGDFLPALLEISGYRKMLEDAGEEGKTRLENVEELISSVKQYAAAQGPEASLEGFLEEVALIADIDNYDEAADAVTMMTMHSAKGLEFPYVFIVGLEEGIFPGEQSRYDPAELQEERRLCYVGITRAKKKLYLTRAEFRMLFGQTRRNKPSRFLEEVGEELLEASQSARQSRSYLKSDWGTPERKQRFADEVKSAPRIKKLEKHAAAQYAPGDAVEHKVFGRGVVQQVSPIAGDFILVIDFDTAGRKKTMANYAPLTKIEEAQS